MNRLWTIVAAVVASIGLASSAAASTLVFTGTTLTAVEDLLVDGSLYDVEFVDDTCVDIFTGCDALSDFDFTSSVTALAAVQALILAIGAVAPTDVFGCGVPIGCVAYVPFQIHSDVGAVALARAGNAPGTASDFADVGLVFVFTSFDSSEDSTSVWADFRVSDAAVPEPATLTLFGVGLAGVGARRWQQRKRT